MKTETSKNEFWVYVLQSDNQKQWTISTTRDLKSIMQQCKDDKSNSRINKLIYRRRFDEMLLALGHKMLLSFLDRKSVISIIQKENPNMENLAVDFYSNPSRRNDGDITKKRSDIKSTEN